MQRLFITYRLKAGARMQDFWKFSREIDQPLVKRQEGVHGFEVFEITASDKGKPDVDIVESILVDSYEKWVEITGRDDMKNNSGNWGKVGDETSVRVLIGKKIE
ncbi:MAG: hypothetical protein ABSG17_06945 [Spirochaetia bacterium]|jgi:hypothetical protein